VGIGFRDREDCTILETSFMVTAVDKAGHEPAISWRIGH
jgi:hypothetical protein